MLIVVAYQFLVAGKLPRISYLTFMDAFLVFSFMMMAATILQNGLVSHWHLNEYDDKVRRLDVFSRWAFPLGYVLGVAALAFAYGIG